MIEPVLLQDFTEIEGATIPVKVGDQLIPLKVVETRALPPISPRHEPFVLTLQGPRDPALTQGIKAFMHPRRGQLDIFIVPVARDATHTTYEAVFN
jgi:hypothetical protein